MTISSIAKNRRFSVACDMYRISIKGILHARAGFIGSKRLRPVKVLPFSNRNLTFTQFTSIITQYAKYPLSRCSTPEDPPGNPGSLARAA